MRAVGDDALGQVVLQGHRQTIVHVDLDRDQQAVADRRDGDFGHRLCGRRMDCLRCRDRPARSAEERDERIGHGGLDTTFGSGRVAVVCAICGRCAQDAIGAHQPCGRDRLDQVRDQRIDGRHAGDVDGDLRPR